MINQHEFRRNNPPAVGESETEYFLRIANKFHRQQKAQARQRLLQALSARLRALIAVPVAVLPLRTKRA